ncbi:MAG: hypothetical protein JRI97_12240 [Deltaproteobacteria bacterium]|nr:hypothetical protein [Deltaproteobacteria bacterium]
MPFLREPENRTKHILYLVPTLYVLLYAISRPFLDKDLVQAFLSFWYVAVGVLLVVLASPKFRSRAKTAAKVLAGATLAMLVAFCFYRSGDIGLLVLFLLLIAYTAREWIHTDLAGKAKIRFGLASFAKVFIIIVVNFAFFICLSYVFAVSACR